MTSIKRSLAGLVLAVLFSAACMGALAPRDAPVSLVPRFAGERVQPRAGGGLPTTSDRWAGYALTGGVYTSMQGSWNVPTVSYAPGSGSGGTQNSSTWIGIGGNGTTDNTLVQLGTLQAVNASGATQYYAWYLFYGGLGLGLTPLDSAAYPINPGDTITATISCTANCIPNATQTWQLTMNSARWADPWRSPPVPYQDSLASAEWIMEAATVGSAISDMPDFTPVNFSNTAANGSVPNLTSSQAIELVNASGAPLAQPLPPSGAGAFSVDRIGLPIAGSLPSSFAPNKCPPAAMLGEMTPAATSFQGSLAPGQPAYEQFYVTKYSQINTGAPSQPSRPYAVEIIDDLTGNVKVSQYFQNGALYSLSLDPGFYCVRVRGLAGEPAAYNFQLSASPAGYVTSSNMNAPQELTLMDLGNLSSNLYYSTRYVWPQTHPGDANSPPATLAPGHVYELRDWVGVAAPNQWYRFTLDAPRNLNVTFNGLYLGATVSLLDTAGNLIGATVYSNSSPLGPILASQSYVGQLPAGNYNMRIAFSGVGSPGTRFTLDVTAQ